MMQRDLVEIEGGAIWVRADLGAVMVVDLRLLTDTLPPELADAGPGLPPPASAPARLTDRPIVWQSDIRLMDRSIRLRSALRLRDIGLAARLAPLADPIARPPDHCVDLYEADGSFHLWCDEALCRTTGTVGDLAGEVYCLLLSLAARPRSIALFIHAAALVIDGVSLLLSAASGGGKTTLSLGLAAGGATLLSDDTIGLIEDDFSLVGLPVAMRIRATGWEVAAALLPQDAVLAPPNRLGIRHIPPQRAGRVDQAGPPAAAAIMLDFQPGAMPAWRMLSQAQGFAAIIGSGASLPDRPGDATAESLARWCRQTRFYQLTYGSLKDGIEGVHAIRAALAS